MTGIRHPARHYVNYLLSRRVYGVAALLRQLEELGLHSAAVTVEELKDVREQLRTVSTQMQFPSTFDPRAANPSPETAAFLKRWRIRDAWAQTAEFNTAVDLLADPPIRRALQLMLLSPLNLITVASRLARTFDLPFTKMNAGVVRMFSHYFWDPTALSMDEWRRYLSERCPEEAFEYLALLQAPRSSAGAALALALGDRDASLLPPAERYEMVAAAGFRKFMEHMTGSSSSSSSTYAALAALTIMRAGDTELDKYRGGSATLLEELQRMTPVYDPVPQLSLRDMYFVRPPINTTAEPVAAESAAKETSDDDPLSK